MIFKNKKVKTAMAALAILTIFGEIINLLDYNLYIEQ